MNEQEIIEGNKLIADFMGWQHHEDKKYDAHEMSNLKYHTSWDWLKPVVDKFMSIPPETFNYDSKGMSQLRTWKEKIKAISIYSNIMEVYNPLIEAIKWYNQNQTP
jgi:hypothetical protein